MTVTKLGKAIQNPRLGKTHPSYVGRVIWAGNISNSYAAFQLVNITLSDSNAYGCQLDVGGFDKTIHSKITFIVEVRICRGISTCSCISSIELHFRKYLH